MRHPFQTLQPTRWHILLLALWWVVAVPKQMAAAENQRFVRGTGTNATYHSFVIPLDFQPGVEGSEYEFPSDAWWHFDAMHPGTQALTNNRIHFNGPLASFGSFFGAGPLYIGQAYRFGCYAGGLATAAKPWLTTNALIIDVFNRQTLGHVRKVVIPLPNPRNTNQWNTFLRNGSTVSVSAPGLDTTVFWHDAVDWGTELGEFGGDLIFTHTGRSDAAGYLYLVQARGFTPRGEMVLSQSGTTVKGDFSMLYWLAFDPRPAWHSVMLDQPQFSGEPMPSEYLGKSVEELMAAPAVVTNTTTLSPAACAALNHSPELRRHPILDRFVQDLGNDPLALAAFVQNEIELTDAVSYNVRTNNRAEASLNPGGVSRGALGVFLERQGSPLEQCALLIYLLRQAGYPAAYVFPETNSVKMLDSQLSKLLRVQLRDAGDNQGASDVPRLIAVNYPWVTVHLGGDNWVPVFPWLKDTEIVEGFNLYDFLPTTFNNGAKWVRQYLLGDANILGLAPGRNTRRSLGVLLVVDAAEGPQAQTRFVLRKALEAGAKPIVVINKIDRENANPKKVLDEVFELFISLKATDEQLDFPFVYCSAKAGYAKTELDHISGTMEPLFDAITKHIPPPRAKAGEGFQVLVANLDYSDYLGRIAFGKIVEGRVRMGEPACCLHGNGRVTPGKITMIYHFEGLKRIEIQEAHAGDIVGITGFEDVFIGETLADKPERGALPYIPIDPPTIQMEFAVNDGPLAGLDGKLVTARHIWERLTKEIRTNVALRIAQTSDPKIFAVSGRGEMQIAILVEQMRRERHEVLVSRPEVLWKKAADGTALEPIEKLFVEVPSENLGAVMENLSFRKAQITNMNHVGAVVSVEALVPMRGLIGFETDLVNMTRGMGVMSHLFHEYGPDRGEIAARKNGSLVSMDNGEATSYALNMIQERGRLLVIPGDQVYAGMIVGENAREQDIPVNPVKEKRLTNMRSQGDGKGIQLNAPLKLSLERALEYIDVDEYVEATPKNLRLRKKILDETQRKRAEKTRVLKFIE